MLLIRYSSLVVFVVASALGLAIADDSGRSVLERCVDHYADLDAYAADMTIDLVLPEQFAAMGGGMVPSKYSAVVSNDGRVALRPQGGMITDAFIQDEEQWYAEIGYLSIYVLADPVPMEVLASPSAEYGVPLPGGAEMIRFALREDVSGSLLAAESVTDAGFEEVNGVNCRRLELSGEFTGEAWIAEGEAPWIMRLAFDPPKPEDADEGGMMIMPTIDVTYAEWRGDPDLDGAFDIILNPDYSPRDSMPGPEDFGGAGGAPGGEDASIGEPAPGLELATLDGGSMSLEKLKGKVVVLDFWAVWCKPCLMALPGVMEVTSELADRGVEFWAVNQRDKVDKINALLAEKGWKLPVALDTDGSAGNAFGVQGIPHTVVIDKKGVVRHVHSGFFPGMEKQLRSELEALLSE